MQIKNKAERLEQPQDEETDCRIRRGIRRNPTISDRNPTTSDRILSESVGILSTGFRQEIVGCRIRRLPTANPTVGRRRKVSDPTVGRRRKVSDPTEILFQRQILKHVVQILFFSVKVCQYSV